jgi:hypothetical protein
MSRRGSKVPSCISRAKAAILDECAANRIVWENEE